MSDINECFQIVKQRANDMGVATNISPERFNLIWKRAELKFFNNNFRLYADRQEISDSISKWLSHPLYLFIAADGKYPFFTGMNLLHVDSLNSYLSTTATTGAISGISLSQGSGYTNGTFDNVTLIGGRGTYAAANITVSSGIVVGINYLNSFGVNYQVGDVLTAPSLAGGTGFSITVSAIVDPTPYDIQRVEKNRVSVHRASTYDAPDREFAIYTQYEDYFQFYPQSVGIVELVYLKQPTPSFWAYTLNGYIDALTSLVGGTGYTNGTYNNVALTGGLGNSALANIVVSGNAVTSVTITKAGKLYRTGDILSALNTTIGGTGTGFSITVASILNGRPVYNAGASVQPKWNDNDISIIVDFALQDIAINSRDQELQSFAQTQSLSKQLQ